MCWIHIYASGAVLARQRHAFLACAPARKRQAFSMVRFSTVAARRRWETEIYAIDVEQARQDRLLRERLPVLRSARAAARRNRRARPAFRVRRLLTSEFVEAVATRGKPTDKASWIGLGHVGFLSLIDCLFVVWFIVWS